MINKARSCAYRHRPFFSEDTSKLLSRQSNGVNEGLFGIHA